MFAILSMFTLGSQFGVEVSVPKVLQIQAIHIVKQIPDRCMPSYRDPERKQKRWDIHFKINVCILTARHGHLHSLFLLEDPNINTNPLVEGPSSKEVRVA